MTIPTEEVFTVIAEALFRLERKMKVLPCNILLTFFSMHQRSLSESYLF